MDDFEGRNGRAFCLPLAREHPELGNIMERAYLLSGSKGRIDPDVLPQNILHRNVALDEGNGMGGARGGLESSLDLVERDYVKRVLEWKQQE